MGSISAGKRADGTAAYAAQIRLKDQDVIVPIQAQAFTQKALVHARLQKKQKPPRHAPGGLGWVMVKSGSSPYGAKAGSYRD